jgi:hypothetical protein
VSTIWVFPYYMERQLKQQQANLVMSDYRVTYSGHVQFGAQDNTDTQTTPGARKLGSPVRLFTDIPLTVLHLPASEGYRLCEQCRVWVAAENRHCDECGTCTSKVRVLCTIINIITMILCRMAVPMYMLTVRDVSSLPTVIVSSARGVNCLNISVGEVREVGDVVKDNVKKVVVEEKFSGKRKSRKRNRLKRERIPKKC